MDSSFSTDPPLPRRLLGLLGLCVVAGFWFSGWMQSGGHLMAPLDDTFIHLTYAQRLARGNWFSYAPGMGYSSGATSLLWVGLLTPIFWAGVSGVKALACALAVCGAFYLAAGWFLYRLGGSFYGPALAVWLGLLYFLQGHVAWAFLNGMETALFGMLMLAALWGWRLWTEEESRGGRLLFAIALALLPLTRPEGWILWVLAAFVIAARAAFQLTARRDLFLLALTPLPGLIAAIVHYHFAGQWATNGMILKGLWSQNYLSGWERLGLGTGQLAAIFTDYFNNRIPDPRQVEWRGHSVRLYLPPLAAWLAVLGGGIGLAGEWRRGRPAIMTLATLWWVGGLCSVACSYLPFIHNQRYLAPWTPLCLFLALAGVHRIARLFDPHERNVLWSVGVLWAGVSLAGLGWWGVEYGRNTFDIFHQHRRMSWMLQEHAAPGECVGVTDAGVLAFYGNRPVLDLVGLCAPVSQAMAFREGEGSLFERLEAMPESRRPAWIVTYPEWWSSEFPLGEWKASAGLENVTIAGGLALSLYHCDWRGIGLGRLPSRSLHDIALVSSDEEVPVPHAWEIVDHVDVADLESEKRHAYRHWESPESRRIDPDLWPRTWNVVHAWGADVEEAVVEPAAIEQMPLADVDTLTTPLVQRAPRQTLSTPTLASAPIPPPTPSPAPTPIPLLYDGGRVVTGGEEFTVRVDPARPALLLWRTDADTTRVLHVWVNGEALEPWEVPAARLGHWRESVLFPAISKPASEFLHVRVESGGHGSGVAAHRSFHWWVLQPLARRD